MNAEPLLENMLGDNPEEWERPSVLAKLIGVQTRTLTDWIRLYPNDLPALKTPGGYRLRRSLLVEFVRRWNAGEIVKPEVSAGGQE